MTKTIETTFIKNGLLYNLLEKDGRFCLFSTTNPKNPGEYYDYEVVELQVRKPDAFSLQTREALPSNEQFNKFHGQSFYSLKAAKAYYTHMLNLSANGSGVPQDERSGAGTMSSSKLKIR